MDHEILRLEAIAKETAGKQILEDIWLSALSGEIVGVFGLYGESKDAVIRLLEGRSRADRGRIFWNGELVPNSGWSLRRTAGKISFIPMGQRLIESFTAAENLFLMRENAGWMHLVNRKEMEDQAQRLFGECGLSITPSQKVERMEPPDRMMLEILSALCHGTQLLILDDSIRRMVLMRREYTEVLREALKKTNAAILLLSDSVELMSLLCSKVSIIREGVTLKTLDHPDGLQQSIERYFPTEPREKHGGLPRENRKGREVLACRELQMPVRGKYSEPSSFSVQAGEIVGIVSPDDDWNLALTDVLSGRRNDWKGAVFRNKSKVSARFLHHQACRKNRMCVLYDMENPAMISGLTLEENFMLTGMKKVSGAFGFLGKSVRHFSERYLQSRHITEAKLPQVPEMRVQLTIESAKLAAPELLVILNQGEAWNGTVKNILKSELNAFAETAGVLLIFSSLVDLYDMCDRIIWQNHGETILHN